MRVKFWIWARSGFPGGSDSKEFAYNAGDPGSIPGLGRPWRRKWQPTPVLLPGKSHGQRSLVGCGPWGCEELDTAERLHFHFSLSCIGEGNGNPLQYSCLENPRDGGAWWAAIYGVTQSRTWLKWFSSSNNLAFIPVWLFLKTMKYFTVILFSLNFVAWYRS